MNTRFITRIYRSFVFASALAGISLLSACGGDDGPVAANPTGYYTGTADVFDGTDQAVHIQDLQGLVENNRFMAMSEAQELLYDVTITSISGNNFSATVKVYKDGALVTGSPTSFSGQIQQGVQITGSFSGTGDWRGAFTLAYAASNSEQAALTTVASGVDEFWGGSKYPTDSVFDPQFRLDENGTVIHYDIEGGASGPMLFCGFNSGSIVPVANTRLYRLTVIASGCDNGDVNGEYTGLATTKNNVSADDTLVFMISKSDTTNGAFAHASDYIRRTIVN